MIRDPSRGWAWTRALLGLWHTCTYTHSHTSPLVYLKSFLCSGRSLCRGDSFVWGTCSSRLYQGANVHHRWGGGGEALACGTQFHGCCAVFGLTVLALSPFSSSLCDRSTPTSVWLRSLCWIRLWSRWTTSDQVTVSSASVKMTSTPSADRLRSEDRNVLWFMGAYLQVSVWASAKTWMRVLIHETSA